MRSKQATAESVQATGLGITSDISANNGEIAPAATEIQARAYEIYVGRGQTHGFDSDDWLRAEQELLEKYKAKSRAVSSSQLEAD